MATKLFDMPPVLFLFESGWVCEGFNQSGMTEEMLQDFQEAMQLLPWLEHSCWIPEPRWKETGGCHAVRKLRTI